MIIVGISGKKLSGKDTLCQFISEASVLPVYRIGFADALKEEVSRATGMTLTAIECNKARFRGLLQAWGTDFRRHFFGDNYWVDKVYVQLNSLPDNCIAVIPDVRFLSEAESIKRIGGLLVRVDRKMEHSVKDLHSSEIELDGYNGFDERVSNHDSLADYHLRALELMKKLNIKTK